MNDILFIKYKLDPIGWLIRIITKCEWNHCAWILNDKLIIECGRGGIQIHSINKFDNKLFYKIKAIKIKGLSKTEKMHINNYLLNKIRKINYYQRLLTLIKIFLRLNCKNGVTCSSLIIDGLNQEELTWSIYSNPKTLYKRFKND